MSLPRIRRPMITQLFERRNHQLAGLSTLLLVGANRVFQSAAGHGAVELSQA